MKNITDSDLERVRGGGTTTSPGRELKEGRLAMGDLGGPGVCYPEPDLACYPEPEPVCYPGSP